MDSFVKYNYYLGKALYLLILIGIINNNRNDFSYLFLSLFIIAVINDHFRYKKLYYARNKYNISFLISVFIGGALLFYIRGGYTQVYMFMLLYEAALFIPLEQGKYLYGINMFVLLYSIFKEIYSFEFLKQSIFDLIMIGSFLLFYTISLFSYKALIHERNRVVKLNKEIEELVITKERSRVAQEIHDSLGHSLIALNMKLDVVGNMVDKDDYKIKEVIEKCQSLTKESMDSLRKAVYALKDEDMTKELIKSIQGLSNNIGSGININYNIDENIENYSLECKHIIYNIIKESLTNSIKHSKGNEVNINLEVKDEIYLKIEDDGVGCENLVKGNGLMGIEKRVSEAGGSIYYEKGVGEGFITEVRLPYR